MLDIFPGSRITKQQTEELLDEELRTLDFKQALQEAWGLRNQFWNRIPSVVWEGGAI